MLTGEDLADALAQIKAGTKVVTDFHILDISNEPVMDVLHYLHSQFKKGKIDPQDKSGKSHKPTVRSSPVAQKGTEVSKTKPEPQKPSTST
uniref:Uncharacterized protein n=1 Tax=Romanomermis culicivorax TaxID=13658 RepID=A0A915L0N4_ROMCU